MAPRDQRVKSSRSVFRGAPPEILNTEPIWFNGPEWLAPKSEWPNSADPPPLDHPLLEQLKSVRSHVVAQESRDEHVTDKLITGKSKSSDVVRTTAFLDRFMRNCRNPKDAKKDRYLGAKEYKDAENGVIRHVQNSVYSEEIKSLQKMKTMLKNPN